MYLAVSAISGSSQCTKYLRDQIYTTYSRNNQQNNNKNQTISQILGIGIHEMIQYFLELPSENRMKDLEQCQEDLEKLRQNHLETTDLLIDAFPENYFSSGILYPKISKTWTEASPLLQGCINFLHALEKKWPESKDQWEIVSEIPIHKKSDCDSYDHTPGVSRFILQNEVTLRGFVDLVFVWKNYRILGELKTGKHTKQKQRNWENQVKIYMDVWDELHPEHKVYGVILHKGLRHGFKNVSKRFDFDLVSDADQLNGGPQCRNCNYKERCLKSTYSGAPMFNL